MASQERRHAFRIDDQVHMSLSFLDDNKGTEAQLELSDVAKMAQQGLSTLRELNYQSGHILAGLRKTQPEVSQYLSLLDRKINILTHLAASAHYGIGVEPNSWVNLSARGMAFDVVPDTYRVGEQLMLQLMLFPSYVLLDSGVRVVSIRESAKEGKVRVAVEFDGMSEQQREVLLRHITERQSEQLRRQRATKS